MLKKTVILIAFLIFCLTLLFYTYSFENKVKTIAKTDCFFQNFKGFQKYIGKVNEIEKEVSSDRSCGYEELGSGVDPDDPKFKGFSVEGDTVNFIFFENAYKEYLYDIQPSQVNVAGEMNKWDPNNDNWRLVNNNGLWTLGTSKYNCPNRTKFKFTVNGGGWMQPPKGLRNLTDDGFGGCNLFLDY